MSKITLSSVGSLIDATTAQTAINTNFDTIEEAFDNTLSRDGTTPNIMESTLDMNSEQIINLPQPLTANSPLRLQDLDDFIGGGTITNIPAGGNASDILKKSSADDYEVEWDSLSNILVAGGATGTGAVVLANTPTLVTPILGTPTSVTLTNATGLPISTGVSGLATGIAAFLATPTSANLITAVTNETGTGSLVFSTSPTLVTPVLGTPASGVATNLTGTAAGLTAGNVTTNANLTGVITSVGNATSIASQTGTGTKFVVDTSPTLVTPLLGTPTSGTLTNCTGLPVTTGISGLAAGVSAFLATPSSANLITAVTDETGTGSLVFATSPTLVTPILGTPTSVTLTNATGLPVSTGISGLATGIAAFLATPSSANLAAAITDETGSGANVFATSPTLVTPVLGVASATTINKVTFTAPASAATLTIPDGVTLTGPASSGTAMTLGNAETVTGAKSFNDAKLILNGSSSGSITLKAAAAAGSNTVTLPAGTTDFSATGGTSQFVKQNSAGAALTVARPAMADISDYTAITSFTPVLTFGGGSTGLTYTTQEGQAQKVGNFVFVRFRIVLSAKGSSTGVASISGLPFTSQANFSTLSAYVSAVTAVANQAHWQIGVNSSNTTMFVQYLSNGTGSAVNASDTDFTNTTTVWGTGVYAV